MTSPQPIRGDYARREPRRPRLVKREIVPMDRPAALAVIRRAKDAARYAWGHAPESSLLGRAVATAGVSHAPWLDHPRVLGTDPAKWVAFTKGLREVWAEQAAAKARGRTERREDECLKT